MTRRYHFSLLVDTPDVLTMDSIKHHQGRPWPGVVSGKMCGDAFWHECHAPGSGQQCWGGHLVTTLTSHIIVLSVFTPPAASPTEIFHPPLSITGGRLISSQHRSSSVMDVKITTVLLLLLLLQSQGKWYLLREDWRLNLIILVLICERVDYSAQ